MKKTLSGFLLMIALLMHFSGAWASDTFATGNGYFTTLGLETNFPSDYDYLTVTGNSGSITGTGQYDIASLLFSVGYNAWHIHTDTGTVGFNFAINGTNATLTLPYTINISYQDTLSLGLGTLNLTSGGKTFSVSTLPNLFSNVGTNGFGSNSQQLMSNISVTPVPEPSTYAMLLAGLGLIVFIAYRRKDNSSDMPMAA
jgi:hypothetical protein